MQELSLEQEIASLKRRIRLTEEWEINLTTDLLRLEGRFIGLKKKAIHLRRELAALREIEKITQVWNLEHYADFLDIKYKLSLEYSRLRVASVRMREKCDDYSREIQNAKHAANFLKTKLEEAQLQKAGNL